jgi:hypothetical protein
MDGSFADWLILVGTGVVAYHSLTFRDKDGEKDWVRLLFGCIAALFFVRVLLVEILGIV